MAQKKQTKKSTKVTVTLSERDYEKLTRYAQQHDVVRPLAAKRLLHSALHDLPVDEGKSPKNQLDIFDSIQIDIFNECSVHSEK